MNKTKYRIVEETDGYGRTRFAIEEACNPPGWNNAEDVWVSAFGKTFSKLSKAEKFLDDFVKGQVVSKKYHNYTY